MMDIRIKTCKENNISMFNTYANREQYNEEKRINYRNRINVVITHVPRNIIQIWRTDNNGER